MGSVIQSLLTQTEYLLSGVNMLTKGHKISDTTKPEFKSRFLFRVIKEYDKNTTVKI